MDKLQIVRKRCKHIVLLLGIILLQLHADVPAVAARDTLSVSVNGEKVGWEGADDFQVRKPEGQFLEKFRKDPNFNYSPRPRETSLWQRLVWWFRKHLFHRGGENGSVWLEIFLQVLAVCMVVFLIYKLIRSRYRSPFVRNVPGFAIEEMMEQKEMDEKAWLALLDKAVADGNYILAVRIHYGYILRLMDAKGLIRWNAYRSDRAYYYEIEDEGVREKFGKLIRIFHCVCYGEFRIDKTGYEQVNREFLGFRQEVMS